MKKKHFIWLVFCLSQTYFSHAQNRALKENRANYYTESARAFVKNYYGYLNNITDSLYSPEDRQTFILDAVSDFYESENEIVINDSIFLDAEKEYKIKDYCSNLSVFYPHSQITFSLEDSSIAVSKIFDEKDYYLIKIEVKRRVDIETNENIFGNKKEIDFYLKIIPNQTFKFIGTKWHSDNENKYTEANILYGENDSILDEVNLGKKTLKQLKEEFYKEALATADARYDSMVRILKDKYSVKANEGKPLNNSPYVPSSNFYKNSSALRYDFGNTPPNKQNSQTSNSRNIAPTNETQPYSNKEAPSKIYDRNSTIRENKPQYNNPPPTYSTSHTNTSNSNLQHSNIPSGTNQTHVTPILNHSSSTINHYQSNIHNNTVKPHSDSETINPTESDIKNASTPAHSNTQSTKSNNNSQKNITPNSYIKKSVTSNDNGKQ